MKTFTVKVNVYDEYFDEGPTYAIVEVDEALAKQIIKMQAAVKDCNAYCMVDFDSHVEFKEQKDPAEDDENVTVIPELVDWDGRTECETLHVTDSRFFWNAGIKHTSINMETEAIAIDELKELL